MRAWKPSAVVLTMIAVAGCPKPPLGGSKEPPAICPVKGNPLSPVIAGLEQNQRADIESAVGGGRLVAVKVDQGKIELVSDCKPAFPYVYKRTTWSETRCDLKDSAEAKSTLNFEMVNASAYGKSNQEFSLFYGTRGTWNIVGEPAISSSTGDPCESATHYATAVSVGAWASLYGNRREMGGKVDVKGILSGDALQSLEVSVGQKAGTAEACKETSDQPIGDCSAPLALSLAPLRKGDCILKFGKSSQLAAGSPRSIGQCTFMENAKLAEFTITGAIGANCDHPNQDWCNSPAQWKLQLVVGESRLPFEYRENVQEGKPKTHIWSLAGRSVGSATVPEKTDIRIEATYCHVANSNDHTCYLWPDFEIRVHPL